MTKLGLLMLERTAAVTARGKVKRAQARLEAIGRAYIDFARAEPGWFRTAFTSTEGHVAELPAGDAPVPSDPGTSPFALLNARLDELVEVGSLAPERRPGAEYAAWSSVHGLSSLLLDGPLRALPEAEVETAIASVLGNVNHGLY
jgi:hypothetical protein